MEKEATEKSTLRNKSIGTKVSEEEYAQLEKLAEARGLRAANNGTLTPVQCTALQQSAADLAKSFDTLSTQSGWLATGSGLLTGLGALGEAPSAGTDTPFTAAAASTTEFFGSLSFLTGGAAALLNQFASGKLDAINKFGWSQMANIAAKAAATGIPVLKPLANQVGDLASHAADLALKAQEACK